VQVTKVRFFTDARQAYGRSALLLSGGGSLGLIHIGVVKRLYESSLLPRVISGSSIGALIAGLLGVHTDEEVCAVRLCLAAR
jgi:NTE family protein